jgi:hypothetical protein
VTYRRRPDNNTALTSRRRSTKASVQAPNERTKRTANERIASRDSGNVFAGGDRHAQKRLNSVAIRRPPALVATPPALGRGVAPLVLMADGDAVSRDVRGRKLRTAGFAFRLPGRALKRSSKPPARSGRDSDETTRSRASTRRKHSACSGPARDGPHSCCPTPPWTATGPADAVAPASCSCVNPTQQN